MELEIKEGDFKKYEEIYNSEYFLKDLILTIKENITNFYLIKKSINNVGASILAKFGEDFVWNPNEKNVNDFLTYYKEYSIVLKVDKIKKVVIQDNIIITNKGSEFITDIILNKNIRKICEGIFEVTNIPKISDINHLSINNFEFNSDFAIFDCKQELFSIRDSDFNSDVAIENYVKEINFTNCFFINLNMFGQEISKRLYFQSCTGALSIRRSEIGRLDILNSNLTKVDIKDNIFKERVKISSNILYSTQQMSKIDTLTFSSNTINDLRIGHSIIEKLTLDNLKNPSNSEINLGNIKVKEFQISNIRNLGKFRMYDINYGLTDEEKKKVNEININNSSLGDSEFQNINLNSFTPIKIYDNLFTYLKYTGIEWGYIIKSDKEKNYGKLRNTYRTLKDVAEKNNDSITALEFYAKEMDAYKKYLLNKKDINPKEFNKRIDLFIIRFNEFSSDYGLNFFKPLVIIVGLNYITIFFIMLLSSKITFSLTPSFINFLDFLGYIARGFNVTSGVEYIFKEDLENSFFDLLVIAKNILLGIFLYQTIKAFRKFTR